MDRFPILDSAVGQYAQKLERPQYRSKAESGGINTRPKFTRGRWVFQVGFVGLPWDSFIELAEFFDSHQGGTFEWVHPVTGTVHTVGFQGDELPNATYGGSGGTSGKPRMNCGPILLEERLA